jgi:hypothetical protein
MNPTVVNVKPERDYKLLLSFTNGEIKRYDVKPHLEKGIFRELKDEGVFNSVRPFLDSIQWGNGADLCPDTLYEGSVPVSGL